MTDSFETLRREDVLNGLFDRHAKIANTVLFAIENQAAHLVAQAKQTTERFPSLETTQEHDLTLLKLLAMGRKPAEGPTIQELERYAPQWAALVPERAAVRATLSYLLGQKYYLPYAAVPGIRAALGMDDPAVQRSYQQQYQQPLQSVFVTRLPLGERLYWVGSRLSARLETLHPFWLIFFLTLTEMFSAGVLALPIALAEFGPLAGAVILIAFGVINMFTIAGLAEAVSRNGALRYGETSFSQLVNDSLGRLSSLVFFAGLAATCFLILWAYSVGFAATLAAVTGIPAAIWGIALFLVTFHFIWRGSLNTPFAATLLLSIVGVALILALALLAFIQIDPANFNAATFPQGAFPSSVSLLFGVVSMAYFGHLAIGNSAQVVLRRDSSARSLIWGAVAAQASAILLYCLWVAAVNGALGPQGLSREPGTVLTPLAARLGPAVSAAGLLFALSMGLAVIHFSLRLYHLMREYLPIERQPILVLPQRQGRLILTNSWRKAARARGELRMGLTYLGLGEASNESPEKPARFYLDVQFEGHLYRTELAIKGQWEAEGLLERLHIVLLRKPRLALEILEARPEFVRLKISSSLRLGYEREEDKAIPNAADVFSQPDAERKVVTWMLREAVHGRTEVNLASVMTYTSMAQAEAQALMRRLGEQGFVREVEVNGEIRYRSALSTRRGRRLPKKVWRALDETKDHSTNAKAGFFQHGRGLVFSKVGRAVLSVSPVIAAFLLVEGLLLSGEASFSAPLNFLGVLVTPALGGFFPIWLLLANRSKGEMAPGVVYSFLGRPALLAGIALFYLVGLFLYGVVIWQNPFERAAALISGALLTALTISLARQGAFAPRVVVELRKEQGETPTGIFVVSSGGQAVKADVQLVYRDHEERRQAANGTITAFADLCALHVQLPKTPATELKVWVHAVTPAGSSEGLPAELRVSLGSEEKEFNLRLSAGQVVVPLNGGSCHLTISLPE